MAYDLGTHMLLELQGTKRLTQTIYSKNIRAVCTALELLFALANREGGFAAVHGALVTVARAKGEPSFGRLTWLISECDDLHAKSASLLLINQLVVSAPDEPARQQLLLKLKRRLGFDLLLSAQLHLQDPAFQEQLRVYQQVANVRIPGSWEDADFCNRRGDQTPNLRRVTALPHSGDLPMISRSRPAATRPLQEP